MTTQKAFVADANKSASVVQKPLPKLRDDYILVKVVSVALNPTDWKHLKFGFGTPNGVVGCDYAGIVEEVGSAVKKPFKKGDRICGLVHGCNSVQTEDGAFAEYIVAKGDVQWPIPDNITFQQAATLGVGIVTTIQALYQGLELQWPRADGSIPENKGPVLIYGGSTATGYIAIQFAKLSGYTVLATSSPHNFDYLKEAGADYVFNYKDPNSKEEIRKVTDDKLQVVLDCVATAATREYAEAVISPQGGKYHPLLNQELTRKDIKGSFSLAYTFTGEDMVKFGNEMPAKPADKAYIEKFNPIFEALLAQGKIKPIKYRLKEGGLNGIPEGLKELEEDKASGEKIVYNIADTA